MKILEKKYIQPLYKIKQFGEFVGLTVDTLLFYEKIDLFKPFQISKETGYRYYSLSQLYKISQIIQLKSLGLTLQEIKQFMLGEFTINEKINLFESKIESLQGLLQLCSIFQTKQTYSTYTKEVPQHFAYVVETTVKKSTDILFEYEKILNNLLKNKIKIKHPYNFCTKFHDQKITFVNNKIEIFAEVLNEDQKTVLIPKQKFICTLHFGDYRDIEKAYNFLFEYCEKSNIKILDYPSEQYIESFGSKDNENEFVTEIRLLIE